MSQNQMFTTLTTMESASKSVKQIALQINEELTRMQNQIRQQLDGTWAGEARGSTDALVEAFAQRQLALKNVLDQFADGISSNMTAYGQHEQANLQASNRLAGLLA